MCSEPFSTDLITWVDYQFIVNPHVRKEKADEAEAVSEHIAAYNTTLTAGPTGTGCQEKEEGQKGRNAHFHISNQEHVNLGNSENCD